MKQKPLIIGFAVFAILIIVVLVFVVINLNANINSSIPTSYSLSYPVSTPVSYIFRAGDSLVLSYDGKIYTFTSNDLGIQFKFLKGPGDGMTAKRIDNKVYVYYSSQDITDGQYVEVFDKDSNTSLSEQISKQFLNGISTDKCYVDFKSSSGNSMETAAIKFPLNETNPELNRTNAAFCPDPYTPKGFVAYFLGDKNHPDKFVFFNIGQYAISGDSDKNLWVNTFQFLNDVTYTNKNLPGLALKYPSTWQILVKEFTDKDTKGFQPKYFPECTGHCMGINFSKGTVSLNMIFDLAYDDAGRSCSNKVEFNEIGNGWVRIKGTTGYFYSKSYNLNVTTSSNEPYTFGKQDDEWSLLNNTSYKICDNGSGYFRTQSANVYPSDASSPGTLVERPTISGNPSQSDLSEVDSIIKTLN